MTLRVFILSLALAALAGCGFHLRGATPLPELMARTYLDVSLTSPLRYELESLLLSAGGEVMDEEEGATAILKVKSASIRSRTLSLDDLGRVREYGLTLTVKYLLLSPGGEALSESLRSSVERDYRFDPDNVLAQGREREMVEQEMYRIAAQQMVRRLRTLGSATEVAPESAPSDTAPAESTLPEAMPAESVPSESSPAQ
jgi:LPS-assembly lipoprotein